MRSPDWYKMTERQREKDLPRAPIDAASVSAPDLRPPPALTLRTSRAEIAVRQFVSPLTGKTEYALYIDGDWQFATDKERVYHESLCVPPWALAEREPPHSALVLGGGDGLAVRTLNRLTGGATGGFAITLVDYDQEFVRLCTENPVLREINEASLSSSNLRYECADAYEWVKTRRLHGGEPFDIVLMDYPGLSPRESEEEQNLRRLFSPEHFADVFELVALGGALCAQFSCPFRTAREIMGHLLSTYDGAVSLFRFSPHYVPWRDSAEEFLLVIKDADPFIRRSPMIVGAKFMDFRRVASILACRRVSPALLEHEELLGGPWMAP